MKTSIFTILLLLIFSQIVFSQEKKNPSFEEVMSLRSAGTPIISPDGRHILFSVGTTDWDNNRFDREIWISKNGATPFQLTNTPKGSSSNYQWSPDGKWISFTANRGDKNQIYVMRTEGGEAFPITHSEEGVSGYEWSPDGKQIAFTQLRPEVKSDKSRKERYGSFSVEDQEYRMTELWLIDFQPDMRLPSELPCYDKDSTRTYDCIKWPEPQALIDSVEFTIRGFQWSPDGKKIAFNHQPDPLINSFFKADISILDVATKEVTSFVSNPSADGLADWSPDGQSILYTSSVNNTTSNYYENTRLFIKKIGSSSSREIAKDFDEDINGIEWTSKGIFFTAWQKTERGIFLMDPQNEKVRRVFASPEQAFGYTLTMDGEKMAFSAQYNHSLGEIFTCNTSDFSIKKITNFTDQIKGWKVAQSEVISWKSKDGATIEGILHKPEDYDPDKKYPLLVVIHGGPTGIDRPTPVPAYVYPIVQWLNKGALVLRPNYRGSAGYGAKFRELNVENLGVGDAWDVLSGVEHLDKLGMIDTDKMGAMGWSQGGYISAFLTTTSNRFKAISVGAGISDWTTYYVNTDIHPFTRQYLKATPWENEEIYRKTSPMTYINDASTPTLIQHGEFDRRVPIPNAYKLLQGLEDRDIPAKLVVYKGFGHGITKPKERLAALWHNWQWFGKYVFGEEIKIP
jgi:dipeptidyl aminopeptidase/acylaminoacyl peptidase